MLFFFLFFLNELAAPNRLGIWLWVQNLRLNGEVAMCFWILWFQSYSFQTRVGSLNNGQVGTHRVSLLCHPSFLWVEGNASAASNNDSLHWALSASEHPKCFPSIVLFKPPSIPLRPPDLPPPEGISLLWGVWCSERLSNLPKVTKHPSDRIRIWTHKKLQNLWSIFTLIKLFKLFLRNQFFKFNKLS